MGARTSQLQIRVTPAEKAALKRLADASGDSVSGYVLSRVLPSAELELGSLLDALTQTGTNHRVTLAEFQRTLDRLGPVDLTTAVPPPAPGTLSPVLLNCVAAMVESTARRMGSGPPPWVRDVPPLPRPHFGWVLRSLRPHQLRVAPVAFKRRNIFFDPATGPSP
jgi:hypothetical protein